MFVRIVRTDQKNEVVIETDRYRLKDGDSGVSLIIGENHHIGNPEYHFELEKEHSEIYIMNNRGQTVESYRWK